MSTPDIERRSNHYLPGDRFFWAVLDPSEAGLKRRPPREQLDYLFEREVPVPVEHLQTAYDLLRDGRYVACGMLRSYLEQAAPPGSLTLCPRDHPDFVPPEVSLASLNLLTGAFEPYAVRRARWQCAAAAAVVLLLLSATITVLLEMRAGQLERKISNIQQARRTIVDDVLGPDRAGSQRPELQLLAELRRLRRTRGPEQRTLNESDVTEHLAALLRHWPVRDHGEHELEDRDGSVNSTSPLYVQTELISITEDVMTVRAALPSASDAERFAAALRPISQWELAQPTLTTLRGTRGGADEPAVQAALRLTPRVDTEDPDVNKQSRDAEDPR